MARALAIAHWHAATAGKFMMLCELGRRCKRHWMSAINDGRARELGSERGAEWM